MEKTVALVFFALLACGSVLAGTYDDYVRQLKIADQSVQRKKHALSEGADALSSSTIKALYGRYYQLGDNWTVASLRVDPVGMRMTSEPERLKPKGGAIAFFKYEVIDLKPGAQPEVTIRVTQQGEPQDPKVESITLKFTDRTVQTEKSYQLKGEDKARQVAPNGVRSPVSLLELFPIDVPEVVTAERMEAAALHALPELPPALRKVAKEAGFSLSAAHASWFEQDDFFGRPVQVLWRQGDPWPAYLKTPNGVAILIRKGDE